MLVHDSGKRWSEGYTRKIIVAQYAGAAASKKLDSNVDLFEEGGECESDMLFSEYLMRFCAPRSCEWIGDPVFESFKEKLWDKAVALIGSNWSAITKLAKALIERRSMSGKAARRILVEANRSKRRKAKG